MCLMTFNGCEQNIPLAPYDSGLPPAVPENLRVTTATDGVVIVRWWENIDPEYSFYNLYRGVNDSVNLIFYKKLFSTFYRDENLFYDSVYYYAVTSVGRNGKESGKSRHVAAKPGNNFDPVLPSYLNVTPVNYEGKLLVSFEWSIDENPDFKGLEVYRSTSQGFTPTQNDFVVFLDSLHDTDSLALSHSVNYYYKFRAADHGGRFSAFSDDYNAFLFPAVEKLSPQNGAIIPFFDVYSVGALPYDLEYEVVVYDSPVVNEVWRSVRYRSTSPGELFIPNYIPSIILNKKYYWRIAVYRPGGSSPVFWSDLSSFQITRFD
ncbi:MAG: hypothetical protein IPJ75_08950 [Ignavibacteriales bacterium]|nr:hypothetical protein [Ignavibacteriales bacterium]